MTVIQKGPHWTFTMTMPDWLAQWQGRSTSTIQSDGEPS